MDCRPLELFIVSANGLKDVNFLFKMDVYAVASVAGDPLNRKQKTKTPVVKGGGTNPKWNSYPIKFTVDEDALLHNRLTLNIKLVSDRTLGDTKIGKVKIPLKDLHDSMGGGDAQKKQIKHVSYTVRSSRGKPKGTINFGYKFGDKVSLPEPQKSSHEPVMAYPVGHLGSSPGYPPAQAYPYPPPGAYPPPPHQKPGYGYAQPLQAVYGYPPQPGYGHPPQPRYGYRPQQVVQVQKPGGNMVLGLGADFLAKLFIGDITGDGGEMADYDAGFGDDDFGGFFDF